MTNMNDQFTVFSSNNAIYTADDFISTHTLNYVATDDDYFLDLSRTPSSFIVKDEEKSYKYAEDQILADFRAYIDKTYGQHYKTSNNIECFDAWFALGDATTTFRDTAIKYLWRYGKKNGNNKDDLMKAMHYVLLAMYSDHYRKKD